MTRASSSILTVATAVVALCAVASAFTIVRREFVEPGKPRAANRPAVVRDWQTFGQTGSRIGSPHAPVLITQFSDFQCPYCQRLYKTLKKLADENPNTVALVYRHFPIDRIHPHARAAAYAAECAGRVGKFWRMHDILYEKQDSIGLLSWTDLSRRAGVSDSTFLTSCMKDSTVAARIVADEADARKLQIRGTPMVLINEWKFGGAPPLRVVDSIVNTLLAQKPR